MELWRKMKFPVRRAWKQVTGIRNRKRGLPKLQHDVKTCEYEDVRVMWNILNNKKEPETIRLGESSRKKKQRPSCNFLDWVKRAPSLCR